MSGTYRGLSVNSKQFRSNSRLRVEPDNKVPGLRSRVFNQSGLYNGNSNKGSALKPPMLGSNQVSATRSVMSGAAASRTIARNTSNGSIKLSSKALPALKSKNRLQPSQKLGSTSNARNNMNQNSMLMS